MSENFRAGYGSRESVCKPVKVLKEASRTLVIRSPAKVPGLLRAVGDREWGALAPSTPDKFVLPLPAWGAGMKEMKGGHPDCLFVNLW